MLYIQSSMPAAAADLAITAYTLLFGSFKNGWMALKFLAGTSPASIRDLKPFKWLIKAFGSFSNFKETYHSFSLFKLPFLSLGTSGWTLHNKSYTQLNTSLIYWGGFYNVFNSLKSFTLSRCKAASVLSTIYWILASYSSSAPAAFPSII